MTSELKRLENNIPSYADCEAKRLLVAPVDLRHTPSRGKQDADNHVTSPFSGATLCFTSFSGLRLTLFLSQKNFFLNITKSHF